VTVEQAALEMGMNNLHLQTELPSALLEVIGGNFQLVSPYSDLADQQSKGIPHQNDTQPVAEFQLALLQWRLNKPYSFDVAIHFLLTTLCTKCRNYYLHAVLPVFPTVCLKKINSIMHRTSEIKNTYTGYRNKNTDTQHYFGSTRSLCYKSSKKNSFLHTQLFGHKLHITPLATSMC
jgi:hypothetical protein